MGGIVVFDVDFATRYHLLYSQSANVRFNGLYGEGGCIDLKKSSTELKVTNWNGGGGFLQSKWLFNYNHIQLLSKQFEKHLITIIRDVVSFITFTSA